MPSHCQHCEGPLGEAAPAHRKFCGDACKQAAYRLRKAETEPTDEKAPDGSGSVLIALAIGVGLLILAGR